MLQDGRGEHTLSLKPYTPNWEATGKFNPKNFVNIPNAYSAAIIYLKRYYGETAVKIFENVVRDNFPGVIKEDDLPKIARIMYERATFIDENTRKTWITHLNQIAYARKGNGDVLSGYIMSFTSSIA